MPPKPMLWDKKGFFKEKKHERYGSPARQQESSSHCDFLEFKQQGSTQFQRVGPGTPGGGGGARDWFPAEPSHGSGTCDMTPREDKRVPSISVPSGITFRSPRDPRHQFWENVNNNTSLSLPSKRPIDDVLTPPSHALLSVNTWNQLHYNDNKKRKNYEMESSCEGWKLVNKLNSSERFYTRGTVGKDGDMNANVGEASVDNGTEESRKKPRLNWGEGLAKFEKKQNEGDGASEADAAATPTSVGCSSLSDEGDTFLATVDIEVSNLVVNTLTHMSSSIDELLESDDSSFGGHSPTRSAAINKLQVWTTVVSKVLDVTETEIHSFENELKSQESEPDEDIGGFDTATCPEPLQIAPSDEGNNVEKMMPLSTNLHGMHDNNSNEDNISKPETATSEFVEARPVMKAVSSCDRTRNDTCSEDLINEQVGSGNSSSSVEIKDGMDAHDALYNTIISSNRQIAKTASAELDKLLPKESGKMSDVGDSSSLLCRDDALIKEKLAEKKGFARFKEKVLTHKHKAFDYLWKKDLCLRSLRKCPLTTSHSKLELGLQTVSNGCQKNRSSIHYRFPFPAGNQLSLLPTSEMINYSSQLLLESKNEVNRSILKMPALILDEEDKMFSKFKSTNGLVEDPVAIEKERAMINPWTSEERKIFSKKFTAFRKDFRKIASFLDHKTTSDCVEFYYKHHKPNCPKKDKKKKGGKSQKLSTAKTGLKASGKKRKSKVNVDSKKKLSEAPATARGIAGNRRTCSGRLLLWRRSDDDTKISTGDDSITERSKSLDILPGKRDKVAADALVGICDSLSPKAMSSSITRSVVEPLEVRHQCQQPVTPDVALVNDVNGGRSDTDDARVAEADSIVVNANSGTKTNEDQPSSAMNLNRDDSNPVEVRNLPADLNELQEINGEVDHEDVNMVSNACIINGKSKRSTDDGCGVVLYNSDKSSSIMEVEKDKVGDAVTELVSVSERIELEPCHAHSVAEDALVSEKLEGLPTCLNDRDGKHEADSNVVVELKNQSHDSNTTSNISLSSSVGVSCSRLTFGAENQPQLEDPFTAANTMLQNTAAGDVQQEKTATLDGSSSTHNRQNPILLDHVEAARILQCHPLKKRLKKQVNADMSCSSSATELPLVSQKIEQTDDHCQTRLPPCLSDSEKTPTNVVFKLFGKIITIPSDSQKPDLTAKGNQENGTHHGGY